MTRLFAILGPTATGKSAVAFAVAEKHRLPIVSVDSMQVYRGLDIGTAKPSLEERLRVPHYMIDVVEPEVSYSVAEFQEEARRRVADENAALIVGGSGLHFRAIVDPLRFPPTDPVVRAEIEALANPAAVLVGADPAAGESVDLANRRRVVRALEILRLTGLTPSDRWQAAEKRRIEGYVPQWQFRAVGLDAGAALPARIGERVEQMREAGWWHEAELVGPRLGPTAAAALGYRELLEAQAGIRDPATVWEDIKTATRDLARRQRTYFRRDPRITWLPWLPELGARIEAVEEALGIA